MFCANHQALRAQKRLYRQSIPGEGVAASDCEIRRTYLKALSKSAERVNDVRFIARAAH
jgi:hypothetical protein